jgi:hypothetical protein
VVVVLLAALLVVALTMMAKRADAAERHYLAERQRSAAGEPERDELDDEQAG